MFTFQMVHMDLIGLLSFFEDCFHYFFCVSIDPGKSREIGPDFIWIRYDFTKPIWLGLLIEICGVFFLHSFIVCKTNPK